MEQKYMTVAVFVVIDSNRQVTRTEREVFPVEMRHDAELTKGDIDGALLHLIDLFLSSHGVKEKINSLYYGLKENKEDLIGCISFHSSAMDFLTIRNAQTRIHELLRSYLFSLDPPIVGQMIYVDKFLDFHSGGSVVVKKVTPSLQVKEMAFMMELEELEKTYLCWNRDLSDKQKSLAKEFGNQQAAQH